ncbi:putative esterase/lipase [Colletotrichum orbiculare MAFF 240422]|uniref:Esterase/lipase n=1 Tax=Colletotrichum orbiculare (strain 104-T / ATCC 96160 / CBS 514.97 / LARS 414 / MAFF 240422) TaxID=1213857 RepID=A0A484FQ01_COLOR|nr:putative esterase/lipase [Colletotrichum orbiculare MAFF 240422]
MGNNISYQQTPVELGLGPKGTIRGLQFDNKARRYVGVPYALPPTGEHRWKKPRPLPASCSYNGDGGAYDATKFKPICPQEAFQIGKSDGESPNYSEDCLFVNIWTPVPKDGEEHEKWPVKLWLHGGWFQIGDPSQGPGMDSTELISTGGLDAVVVAVGYRLNIFGFLAGAELAEESGGEAGGNFGLWDQRVAADRRVFMDSNAIPAQPKTLADVQGQFDEVCRHFGIDVALPGGEKFAALRRKSAEELVGAISHLENHTFRPVTDDVFVHSGLVEYLESKAFADEFKKRGYRLLIGEVRNEETLYSSYNPPSEPTLDALKLQISNYYAPNVTDRALQQYKLPDSDRLEDWQKALGFIVADGQVRASTRALAKALVDNGVDIRDVWRYQIACRLSFIDEKVAPASFGVAHGMDRPIWSFALGHGPTPAEMQLMQDWIQILVALVNDDREYDFGTKSVDEMKVMTPEGTIEVRPDERWDELVECLPAFYQEFQEVHVCCRGQILHG